MGLMILSCIFFFMAYIFADAQLTPDAFTVLVQSPAPGKQITPYLRHQIDTAWKLDELRKARYDAVRTETDLLQVQRETRLKLLDIIGGLPEEKTPLNPLITGTIRMDGYHIEKLIFESLPGFHVSALVYVPDGAQAHRPAVLVACGHAATGKSYPAYQKICGRLALRGYVVLCWDPVGQGERSQFWDTARAESRYNRICGEHAVMGNAAYLAGANLARWEVWDGIRALDYLFTRPEVDSTRISITGSSGGGFQTSFIGALDRRIGVVVPSCYISSLPMRMNNRIFVDPDSDPEQDVYRVIDLKLIKVSYLKPPFRANARLSPEGGKLLKKQIFFSCPFRGKDVRRTGRGLSYNIFINAYRVKKEYLNAPFQGKCPTFPQRGQII